MRPGVAAALAASPSEVTNVRIGVGLPSIIPGTSGKRVIDWGREAEKLGFSSIATLGRLTFPAFEELVSLAAVAAVTDRIELFTNALIEPSRDPVELAKQAATLDNLSDGRFRLGLAVGWRDDDFVVTGRDFKTRGKRFDEDLEVMSQVWAGEAVRGSWKALSPKPTNGRNVPIVIGGNVPAAFARAAKWGIGWTAAGATPEQAATFFEQARQAWSAAGREGAPRLHALAYYGVGAQAREHATSYLGDYYGDWGPGMAAGMPVSPEELRATVKAFEAIGTDEFIFDPTSNGMDQLEGLAKAVFG